ncbi:MAG: hypothetical protein ICV79_19140 [Flavisolibacter sp.]|nr:hypothetical protein [Flavisolibacter sp.]
MYFLGVNFISALQGLTTLDISYNGLTAEGAKAIAAL